MSSLLVSYSNLNLELVLRLIFEHCPGWIIDGSRKQWILYAIRTKDLAFLRVLAQTVRPFINKFEYLELAVGIDDNIPVVEHLLSLNYPVGQLKVLTLAVEKKALKNLKILHEKMEFPVDNYNLFSSAAGTEDNIEIMEYLLLHKCPTSHFTLESAAKNGALNNLVWLLKNGFSMDDRNIFKAAIRSESLEVVKSVKCPIYIGTRYLLPLENCPIETIEWLKKQGFKINSTYVFREAVRNGCLEGMEWLLKNNYSFKDTWLFEVAAEYGSLENLEWLFKNGCIGVKASANLAAAARQGHFEVMKWLLKKKCSMLYNSSILAAAVEFGSLEQMEWLFDNNCCRIDDDDSEILEKAAEKGNVEVMELLIKKGCPTDYAMYGAARHGCLVIMEWLLKMECPIDDIYNMISALEFGSLRNMKWLLKKGCAVDNSEIFEHAARQGSSFLDNGCPLDHSRIMISAARYGSLVNMKWLFENKCPMNDPEIFFQAVCHGSLRNLKWLLENKFPVHEYGKSKAIEIFGSFEKLLQLLELDPSVVIYQELCV